MSIKKIAVIVLILISFTSIVFIVYTSFINTKKQSPTPSQPIVWNKITPGVSTEQDVVASLGNPKSQSDNILFYNSKSPTRDTTINIQDTRVGLIKEIVAYSENRNINEIKSKYGESDYVIYGPDAVNGNYLFVYLNKGVAYLGNPITGSLSEIWYFSPLTKINDFIGKWANGYSLTQVPAGF